MANPITSPSLLTCNQQLDYARRYQQGYRTVWHQHWNRGMRGPLDTGGEYYFTLCNDAGLDAGVWAVLYEDEDAERRANAAAAASRAMRLGAQHLMFDIEYKTDASEIIAGCHNAGWAGPVHLTCLGAPEFDPGGGADHPFYDRGDDLKSFLATGGGIFPQAYYSPVNAGGRHPNYAAPTTLRYFRDQLKVPVDRLNLMLWPNGYNTDALELALFEQANVGRSVSIFLAESTSDATFELFEHVTKAELVDLEIQRQAALLVLKRSEDEMRRRGWTDAQILNQRQPLARRLLERPQDKTWPAVRDAVKQALGVQT